MKGEFRVLTSGYMVKSDSGRRIRVEQLIKAGGQGEAYRATEVNSGELGVVKVFHDRFANAETLRRLEFLKEQFIIINCFLCAPGYHGGAHVYGSIQKIPW